jgi:gliding motility-associated-like protein
MTIFVEFPRNVFIPNLFDPSNTNAANNTFTIWGDEDVVKVNYLRIYDRWGNMVFGNEDFLPNDPAEGWDGGFRNQDMNNAVFVYYAEILFKDGLTLMYVGDVTLKR